MFPIWVDLRLLRLSNLNDQNIEIMNNEKQNEQKNDDSRLCLSVTAAKRNKNKK